MITSVDDIASGLAQKQRQNYLKSLGGAKAAGSFQSSWMAVGNPPAGIASPVYTVGSGYTASKATQGAMGYNNATIFNWLARFAAGSSVPGTLILVDRLWSCSGMGFANATYTVTTPGALPARNDNNGLDAELWVEQFVAAGVATGTLTANYHDSSGALVAGVIPLVVSAPVAGQMQPVPVANNLGIKDLVSVVTSATWTSGTFGMTIIDRRAEIPIPIAGVTSILDWASCGLAKARPDACLQFIFMAGSTTAAIVAGSLDLIDK